MDHLLSLSQAARMVGVKRRTMQQYIQKGIVHAFEGAIRLSELQKVFPDAGDDHSGMMEKMRAIQDSALFKHQRGDGALDAEHLMHEIHLLRIKLGEAEARNDDYRNLLDETQTQLLDLQEQCDQKQAMLLGNLIGWFMHQCKIRQ
jgi:hypothetical protein